MALIADPEIRINLSSVNYMFHLHPSQILNVMYITKLAYESDLDHLGAHGFVHMHECAIVQECLNLCRYRCTD